MKFDTMDLRRFKVLCAKSYTAGPEQDDMTEALSVLIEYVESLEETLQGHLYVIDYLATRLVPVTETPLEEFCSPDNQ